jgi:hypothetical protein
MFNIIVLLRNYPQKWLCFRITFGFYSNGTIGVTSNEWTNNPQYLFTITKKTPIRIILRKNTLTDEDITREQGKK